MRLFPTIEEADPEGTWRACWNEHAQGLVDILCANKNRLAEFEKELIALNDDLIHTNPNAVPHDPEFQKRVLFAATSFVVRHKVGKESASLDDAFANTVSSIPTLTEKEQAFRVQQALALYPRISASFRQESSLAPEARP